MVKSWLYSILEWLLQLVSWNHLLGKLFSNLFLWGSVCLLSLKWVSCMQQNAKSSLPIQSFSLCLLLGKLSSLLLRDIKEKWLLLPVIFVVRGRNMFLWLSSLGLLKDYFLDFLESSFPLCWCFPSIILCRAGFVGRYCVNLVLP